MKGVVEKEVEMPSTCTRAVPLLPVRQVPWDDEPAAMDSTPSAPSAAKLMITIARPAVKKMLQASASSIRHQGIRAKVAEFRAQLDKAEMGGKMPLTHFDLQQGAKEALPAAYMGLRQRCSTYNVRSNITAEIHRVGIIAGKMEV